MRRIRVPFFLAVAFFIPAITIVVIFLARGYKLNLSKKEITQRGILVASSNPEGAQVFIDGELRTATNQSFPLDPGTYTVEIKKEGFYSWVKELKIEKELVVETNAFLLPKAAELRPLIFSGAQDPLLSPDKTKLVYSLPATDSAQSGLFTLDLIDPVFSLSSRGPKQIVQSSASRDFRKATLAWSPDSRQILVSLGKENFLLDASSLTLPQNLVNLSWNLPLIKNSWLQESQKQEEAKLKRLPKGLKDTLTNSAQNLVLSPDGNKLLYAATASAQIPEKLLPPLPASSSQKEEREIKPGGNYVYDLKEDRNFFLGETGIFNWFFTSRHLVIKEEGKISLVEYDGTNKTTVYVGPFENSYIFPAPNSGKIVILTTFGQEENQPPNLYSINLR